MMTRINADVVQQWAADFCGGDEEELKSLVSRHVSDRTVMPDSEREPIEREIARRQIEQNPDADTVDSSIIVDVLAENGFHPAFEYGGLVSGQAAFEALRDAPKAIAP